MSHHDECNHHHHHEATADAGDARRLLTAFALIFVFMFVEAASGIISGSLALLADAAHMLTDAVALGFAAFAQVIASRPEDRRLHFGYRRTQVLAAFVNGVALVFLLSWLAIEALRRLFLEPVDVDWRLMLGVAFAGLAVNGVVFAILHRSETRNVNVRGAMLHVASDLLGSVAAVIAALVIAGSGWTRIDPLLSLLVAALIARSAWKLIAETAHVLMEGAPEDIDPIALKKGVYAAARGVEDVHDLRIWQITPGETALTMHVKIRNPADAEEALAQIKTYLEGTHSVARSTIQVETGRGCPDCDDDETPSDAHLSAEPPMLRTAPTSRIVSGANPIAAAGNKR